MSRQNSKEIENVKVMLLKGESGSSIESIAKTGTSGAVDTYTITLTDGSKFTFNVTNGATITNITKTGTQGLVDTYTITMSDGTTSTFNVTNGADGDDGVGISNIAKTGTSGAVDTYTITLTDGTTYTFTVTNATGIVDATLDKTSINAIQNKPVAEKFEEVDAKFDAIDDDIASTEDGSTASKTLQVGEFILRNNQFYEVTATIAQGGTFSVGANIEAKSIGEVFSQLKSALLDLDSEINVPSTLISAGLNQNTYTGIGSYSTTSNYTFNTSVGVFVYNTENQHNGAITFDLGIAKIVRKIQLQISGYLATNFFDFNVQISNDGKIWTDIYAGIISNTDESNRASLEQIVNPTRTSARYIRLISGIINLKVPNTNFETEIFKVFYE